MIDINLQAAFKQLSSATCPEDVFGKLCGDKEKAIIRIYRDKVRRIHPDVVRGFDAKQMASAAFILLTKWLEEGKKKIEYGYYAKVQQKPVEKVTIKSPRTTYEISSKIAEGDVSGVFLAKDSDGNPFAVKLTRNARNNDLMINEGKVLDQIAKGPCKDLGIIHHIPNCVESFEVKQGNELKRVNVIKFLAQFHSLAEVKAKFPNGLDLFHSGWMVNRLFGALLAAHQSGYIHGAVIPSHFMIRPESHNGVLIGWGNATPISISARLKTVSPAYKDFYPKEVFEKKANVKTDIYMAGRMIEFLTKKEDITPRLRAFIKSLTLANPKARIADAFEAHDNFKTILQEIYGKPVFRKFSME